MSMSNTFIGWVGEAGTVKMEHLSDSDIIDQLIELLGDFTDEYVPYLSSHVLNRLPTNIQACIHTSFRFLYDLITQ